MKENRVIIFTMILNFIVATIKLSTGIIFSFSTLIADSVQSFMDFITDITSLIANKVGKRRANKTYPFGYGQVYYLANLFTAFLLFLIGVFIIYEFFYFDSHFNPSIELYKVLCIVLVLKIIVVFMLKHFGKKYKSELMIEASRESNADFVSTLVVLIVSLLVYLNKYIPIEINFDKIGSMGIALYVFYTSIKMVIANINGMFTTAEDNEEIKEEVIHELEKFKDIELKKIEIIKMSTYYNIFLQVKVNDNLTIKKYIVMEKKIKLHLKSKNRLIRFIDIEPV